MKKLKLQNNTINIVMYHYIRPIKGSKYPSIKGLEVNEFENQINFFLKNANIISEEQLINNINKKKISKKPSVLLTFDDGYKDHFQYVFPILMKNKISGIFYPPQKVVENKIVLDVNKIHFILEKQNDSKKLLKYIINFLEKKHPNIKKKINFNKINTDSRFDTKETILVKRLLQYFLPYKLRNRIINKLFKELVSKDLLSFSKKLYLDKKDILEMSSNGMDFGLHGNYHLWWEHQKNNVIKKEIDKPIKFFNKIIKKKKMFSLCYPYGSFNKKILSFVSKRNDISFALSTRVNNISKKNLITEKFYYPRFDANDFKK